MYCIFNGHFTRLTGNYYRLIKYALDGSTCVNYICILVVRKERAVHIDAGKTFLQQSGLHICVIKIKITDQAGYLK